MAPREPSTLPIIAALEGAEALISLSAEKITDAISNVVSSETAPALSAGFVDCSDIDFGETTEQRATARVVRNICFAMGGLLNGAEDSIFSLLDSASGALNGVIGEIEGIASNVSNAIASALEDVIDTVTRVLDSALRDIIQTAENVVRSVGDFVSDLVSRIDTSVGDILSEIGFTISSLIQVVSLSFDRLLSTAGTLLARIDSTIKQVGEFLVDLAASTLAAMSSTIAATLGPLVNAGESVLGRLGDLVESVPGALKDAAGALADGIGTFVGKPLDAMGSIFVTQVEEFFGALIDEGNLSYGEIIRTLLSRFGVPGDVVEKIAVAADDAAPTTPGFTVMALSFLIPLILAQFIGAALEPVATQLSQEIAGTTKQALISPTDLLDGFFKGDISEDRFREDFTQWGFTEERVSALVATFRHAPDVSVQIQAWLRGLIEEDDLNQALTENRMRANDIRLLKQVVFFVPPAQDLIRMAVREVFSPDVRERFGQDQDFPVEFATFAAQQGISDEWARAYWAAHWALPSPAQGFEMLHRKVIEPADLDVLLRALDVMPFWRNKLTDIAFSPLTRVDLRRMHALGLLTDEQLQTRYEAIGFGADDAALMVAFTVAFNASGDRLPEELEGLTRATVLNLMEDGVIDRDTAVGLLAGMGIGIDAAELFVGQRELEIERSERRDLIESIVALAGGGRISLPVAQDSLAQIGISAIEIGRAVGRIVRNLDNRDRLPTLADLGKMLDAEIIDDEAYLDALKASGFDDTWAAREFELKTGRALA